MPGQPPQLLQADCRPSSRQGAGRQALTTGGGTQLVAVNGVGHGVEGLLPIGREVQGRPLIAGEALVAQLQPALPTAPVPQLT